MQKCKICEILVENITKHHLYPRQKSKRLKKSLRDEVIFLCEMCHKQLHILFTNKELFNNLNSLDKINEHISIKKWVEWKRKKNRN